MKRKILIILTTICLVFSTIASPIVFASTATTDAGETASTIQTTETKANNVSPSIGQVIHGFKLKKMGYDSTTKSFKYLFVHEKTAAKLLILHNNDKNRGFAIKFNTPADNDKGTNHIIEHAVLGGSKKYPSNNLIFDLTNTTYMSFVNALTYQNMTVFPIASGSEEQLLKSADIYLDAVYNPLFLTDENIFKREGWRFELKDELSYNGIVYNEMQGNMGSIDVAAVYNAKKAVFPDVNQGNIAGGDPNEMPKLTYKEFVATYKKNYHPSNSLMVLYGDLDYEAFMKMIDENYLSAFSKKTYKQDRTIQKEFGKLKEKTYAYPAAESANTEKAAIIDLVFALDDIKELGFETLAGVDIVVSLLNLDNSDLKQTLLSSNIGETYSISLSADTFQPTIHFMAKNADPSMKKKFYELVMQELKKIVKNGIDTELIKSSVRSLEFTKALGNDSSTAVSSMLMACLYDNLMGNPLVNYDDYYKKVVDKLDKEKVIEEIIQKHLIDCKTAVLTVTAPEAGLLEKNKAENQKVLAQKKASMSKKELQELEKQTKAFEEWNNSSTPEEVLKSLRAVSLKDLTTEVSERNVRETVVDGVKLWTADANISDISSIYMIFDLSHLTPEELLYLKFYGDMIGGGMATTKRTEGQIQNEITLKAYQFSAATSAMPYDIKDSSARPVFSVSYYGFNKEFDQSLELVADVLLQAKVSDITTYGTRAIANAKAQYQYLFSDPINIALYRTLAYTSPTFQYYNYLIGFDYFNFVLNLEKEITANPENVANKLTEVRKKAFNKNNLTVMLAGDGTTQSRFAAAMPTFTKQLPDVTYQKAVYTLPKPAKREAITVNSPVQYLVANASLTDYDLPSANGKLSVITGLLNNLMLTPEIRLKGGAYGAYSGLSNNNFFVYTYRDSNYVKSLITIGGTDEFLKSIVPYLTEDSLESYKLPAYAGATQSAGEINDAMAVLINKLQGITVQDRARVLDEIKDTSVADLTTYADILERMNSDMNYIVIASPADIEANKELFDEVISLQ